MVGAHVGACFSICMVPGFAGAAPRPGHAKRTNRLPIIQHSNLSNTLQQHNTHTHITLGALYKINKIRCITTTVCKFTKLKQRTTQQHEQRQATHETHFALQPMKHCNTCKPPPGYVPGGGVYEFYGQFWTTGCARLVVDLLGAEITSLPTPRPPRVRTRGGGACMHFMAGFRLLGARAWSWICLPRK